MKQIVLFLSVMAVTAFSYCQVNFNTGDADMDANLTVINTNAKSDLGAFKTQLSIDFGVKVPVIDNFLSMNMEPADVYFAFELGRVLNKPVDDVVAVYKKNKGKGWGVIAKELGIKPGSDEFHALKGKTKGRKDKGNKGNKGNK